MSDPSDNDTENKEDKVIEIYWKLQPRTSWEEGFARGVTLAVMMILAALILWGLLTAISP
jgi:hypothetical protein